MAEPDSCDSRANLLVIVKRSTQHKPRNWSPQEVRYPDETEAGHASLSNGFGRTINMRSRIWSLGNFQLPDSLSDDAQVHGLARQATDESQKKISLI